MRFWGWRDWTDPKNAPRWARLGYNPSGRTFSVRVLRRREEPQPEKVAYVTNHAIERYLERHWTQMHDTPKRDAVRKLLKRAWTRDREHTHVCATGADVYRVTNPATSTPMYVVTKPSGSNSVRMVTVLPKNPLLGEYRAVMA